LIFHPPGIVVEKVHEIIPIPVAIPIPILSRITVWFSVTPGLAHIDDGAIGQGVSVEALVAKGTPAPAQPEVLAVLGAQSSAIVAEQLVLLLLGVHPEGTGTDEIRGDPALWTGPGHRVLELLVLTPPADAVQTEGVIALGQDAKAPLLAALLLHHRVKADAAHLVLGTGYGKG